MDSIYYSPRNVGSLGGIRPLARVVNENFDKTQAWLSTQRAYSLHKPARRRMDTYRAYRTSFYMYQLQADLVEMRKTASKNKNYNYILTVIDLFSRYAWAVPIKRKTGTEICEAFKQIFTTESPIYLQVDQGTEFYNVIFKRFLRENNTQLFSVYSPQKAALVERFNRTLKSRMYRYFTWKNTQIWYDILPDLVHSYNISPHSSLPLKLSPAEARLDGNWWVVWSHSNVNKPALKHKYKVGDYVRISKLKGPFTKGYLSNWSEQLYRIHSINSRDVPVMYTIIDYKDDIIQGNFYDQELQKVSKPEKYPIEHVYKRLGSRTLVKFLGYPEKYWVDEIESSLI